jgi:acyl-CoA thioesterase-1
MGVLLFMNMNRKVLYALIGIVTVVLATWLLFLRDEQKPKEITIPETAQETNLEEYIKIVAFGDSLTAGYGVDLAESYPSVLEKELRNKSIPVEIINMGVSGETTSGGRDRVQFIIEQKPKYVLLGLGANDMLRGTAPTLTEENLKYIIEALQKENINVVLLGMQASLNSGAEYRKMFNAIYPTLSKTYNVPLVPFFLEGVALRPSLNISDGIHPNKEGYEKIVRENILPVVLPLFK